MSQDYNLGHHKLDFELCFEKSQEVYCLLIKFKYIDKMDAGMAVIICFVNSLSRTYLTLKTESYLYCLTRTVLEDQLKGIFQEIEDISKHKNHPAWKLPVKSRI